MKYTILTNLRSFFNVFILFIINMCALYGLVFLCNLKCLHVKCSVIISFLLSDQLKHI